MSEHAEKRNEIFRTEQSIGFIIAGIIVPCFVTLVNDFINVWLGNNYVLDFSVIIVMGINMYLSCVLQPLWTFQEATGLYRQTEWIMIICAVINIVLSYVIGKIYGIAGIIFLLPHQDFLHISGMNRSFFSGSITSVVLKSII